MQKMKMPIITSVIVIALIAAGLGMGTFAYFSDKETTDPAITFTAGNMEISLGTLHSDPVDLSNMQPGDTVTGSLHVKNTGTLDGYLYGRSRYTVIVGPDLAAVLTVTSWTDPDGTITPLITLQALVAQTGVTLSGYGGTWMPYGLLQVNQGADFGITIHFEETAGNEYQVSSIDMVFDILLHGQNVS